MNFKSMVTDSVYSQEEGGNPEDMEVNMDVEMELDEPEPPVIPPPPPPPPSKDVGVVSITFTNVVLGFAISFFLQNRV